MFRRWSAIAPYQVANTAKTPTQGWRVRNILNRHAILDVAIDLQPLEFISGGFFLIAKGLKMRQKMTLARAMNNFLQTHKNYKPTLADINECIYFITCNYMPLFWSIDGAIPQLQRQIESRDQEIAELKRIIATKKP